MNSRFLRFPPWFAGGFVDRLIGQILAPSRLECLGRGPSSPSISL